MTPQELVVGKVDTNNAHQENISVHIDPTNLPMLCDIYLP